MIGSVEHFVGFWFYLGTFYLKDTFILYILQTRDL